MKLWGRRKQDLPGGAGLSQEELQRYSRQVLLPEIGPAGQEQLKRAKVLVVGTGGLGSPAILYLAAAGVGQLGIADGDAVDHSNLHRQIIHSTADVGRPKVESAREAVRDINPNVRVETYDARLTPANALEIIKPYHLVVDGSDNFPTRYLANDACVLLGKPNIYGSIFRFEGQASVFDAKRGPCYRCLYPEPPPPELVPDCVQAGVLGVLPGIVGLIQATEAIKLILGRGEPLIGRLLLFNALAMQFREMKLSKDPDCAVCGKNPSIRQLIDYEPFCRPAPAREVLGEITARDLKARLDRQETIVLLDIREPQEFEMGRLPGAKLIPPGELRGRLGELDRESEIVVYCRSGGRSARAAKLLREAGFRRVHNLKGGLLAWADQIDPTVRKYKTAPGHAVGRTIRGAR